MAFDCNIFYDDDSDTSDSSIIPEFIHFLGRKINGWGYKCCIPERDFLPGMNVFEEYLESHCQNRITFLVISSSTMSNFFRYIIELLLKTQLEDKSSSDRDMHLIPVYLNIDRPYPNVLSLHILTGIRLTGMNEEEWEKSNALALGQLRDELRIYSKGKIGSASPQQKKSSVTTPPSMLSSGDTESLDLYSRTDQTSTHDDDFYKKVLDISIVRFVEDLEPESMLDLFVEAECLPTIQVRDIREMRTTSEKCRAILQQIRSRGRKGYELFKKLLKISNQNHLAEYLIRKERELIGKEEKHSDTGKGDQLQLPDLSQHLNLDILEPCLKIGDIVNIEHGGIACVGPFVRLKETGDVCFVTACHNFTGSMINGLKVVLPRSRSLTDNMETVCGWVIGSSHELDVAIVKISDEFVPKQSKFIDVDSGDLSRAGLQAPYRTTGATNLRDIDFETNTEKRIVVHCPNGRLLYGIINPDKSVTLDSDSSECPVGTSGSGVYLVEDSNSLSCVGILYGMRKFSQYQNILFTMIHDILETFSLHFGQSLVLESFEKHKDTNFLLDPKDAYIFNEALKKGSGKDKFVRINVVGNYGQGKTSLTRRLMNQSLEGIESTDGIDVHVRKCKMKGSEWMSSSTEYDVADCLHKLAEESNRIKAKKDETDKLVYEKNNSPISKIMDTFQNEKSVTENVYHGLEPEVPQEVSVSIPFGADASTKAETEQSFIEKYSSILKEKTAMPSDDTLTANIWDFGGQFIYYATHQIFHSKDAIYLLVFDLRKDLNEVVKDKEFPERKESMGNCLKFWLDSIHAYTGAEEVLTFADVTKPVVILVGTFKDIFKGDSEDKFIDALDLFVDDLSARSHILPEQFAISNTDMSDNEVQKLRSTIFKLGMENAEKNPVPLKWIPLEIALLAEKKKNIITFDDVKALNLKNENLVEEEELSTFLKYLHLKGTLIFFDEEDLKNHIVVNPQHLVDAFRCVIGSKSCIKSAKLHPLWKSLNETAILENELLDAMWKKEVEKDFFKNKHVLLMFLQRHRILSRLNVMDEAGNMHTQDNFMIPSLLKQCHEQEVYQKFTDGKCSTLVSLGYRIENSALLTTLFERVTAGALGKWPPVVTNKQVFVFKNVGYYRLDIDHVGKVELKHGKGIQITVINQCPGIKVESRVCDYYRRYIESLIEHEIHKRKKFVLNNKPFTHYLACSDSSHNGNGSENTYDIEEVMCKERVCCPDFKPHTLECKSAIEEWFLPGKITDLYQILNRRVTNVELGRLAGCIGKNWRLLGVALGVSNIYIDYLEMDYPNQTAVCIYKMLCKWEQMKEDDATLLQLITCIEDTPVVNVDKDMIKNIIDGC